MAGGISVGGHSWHLTHVQYGSHLGQRLGQQERVVAARPLRLDRHRLQDRPHCRHRPRCRCMWRVGVGKDRQWQAGGQEGRRVEANTGEEGNVGWDECV